MTTEKLATPIDQTTDVDGDAEVLDEMQQRYDDPAPEAWLTRDEFRKIWDI